MCGIVLMMSDDKLVGTANRVKAFSQGVLVDTLRGPHSTGLAYVDYTSNAEIYKKPIPGYDFINMPKYNSVLNNAEEYPFIIAHNRHATKGRINTANAHPFQHEHITGVHNGSLYTYRDLAPGKDFDTDSEYIFYALAHNDTADVLKEIDGAFALVWHDARDNTIHIARNEERTFYLAHIKDKKTVLGASEVEMLRLMCSRNNLTIGEEYLVNKEIELVFKLDDLNDPEVIEREMAPVWSYYDTKKYQSGYMKGGGNSYAPFNQNKEVLCFYHSFEYYNGKSGWGYMKGYGLDGKNEEVRVNGVSKNELSIMNMKDGYFVSTYYLRGKTADGHEYISLNRTDVKWLTEKEAFDYIAAEEEGEASANDNSTEDKVWVTRSDSNNRHYTIDEAEEHLKNGCCICADPISVDDYEEIEWWNDEPICKGCTLSSQPKRLEQLM